MKCQLKFPGIWQRLCRPLPRFSPQPPSSPRLSLSSPCWSGGWGFLENIPSFLLPFPRNLVCFSWVFFSQILLFSWICGSTGCAVFHGMALGLVGMSLLRDSAASLPNHSMILGIFSSSKAPSASSARENPHSHPTHGRQLRWDPHSLRMLLGLPGHPLGRKWDPSAPFIPLCRVSPKNSGSEPWKSRGKASEGPWAGGHRSQLGLRGQRGLRAWNG